MHSLSSINAFAPVFVYHSWVIAHNNALHRYSGVIPQPYNKTSMRRWFLFSAPGEFFNIPHNSAEIFISFKLMREISATLTHYEFKFINPTQYINNDSIALFDSLQLFSNIWRTVGKSLIKWRKFYGACTHNNSITVTKLSTIILLSFAKRVWNAFESMLTSLSFGDWRSRNNAFLPRTSMRPDYFNNCSIMI